MPFFMKLFIATHVAVYRATGGLLGAKVGGQVIVLLTTTGHKSGQERTVPVMSFVHEGKTYVIASAAGAPENPAWFKNLVKTPRVGVQRLGRRYFANAVVADEAERAPVWAAVKAAAPGFAEYEKKTTRVIPLVRLDEIA